MDSHIGEVRIYRPTPDGGEELVETIFPNVDDALKKIKFNKQEKNWFNGAEPDVERTCRKCRKKFCVKNKKRRICMPCYDRKKYQIKKGNI